MENTFKVIYVLCISCFKWCLSFVPAILLVSFVAYFLFKVPLFWMMKILFLSWLAIFGVFFGIACLLAFVGWIIERFSQRK